MPRPPGSSAPLHLPMSWTVFAVLSTSLTFCWAPGRGTLASCFHFVEGSLLAPRAWSYCFAPRVRGPSALARPRSRRPKTPPAATELGRLAVGTPRCSQEDAPATPHRETPARFPQPPEGWPLAPEGPMGYPPPMMRRDVPGGLRCRHDGGPDPTRCEGMGCGEIGTAGTSSDLFVASWEGHDQPTGPRVAYLSGARGNRTRELGRTRGQRENHGVGKKLGPRRDRRHCWPKQKKGGRGPPKKHAKKESRSRTGARAGRCARSSWESFAC